jgi:hypothetical protein
MAAAKRWRDVVLKQERALAIADIEFLRWVHDDKGEPIALMAIGLLLG